MSSLERLQAFVDESVGTRGGMIAAISLPNRTIIHASSGRARDDERVALSSSTPFHIASVGKMITASLVLQLAEDGVFGPEGVDALLPELSDRGVIDPVLAHAIHPDAERVSVRHLLSHTSGLRDAQVDDPDNTAVMLGAPAPGSIQGRFWHAVRDSRRGAGDGAFARRRWTPWNPNRLDDPEAGHLNFFLAHGTYRNPVGAPGERFHYSDTAYVVLGTIVERARNASLAEVQRKLVLTPLGMDSTYLAYHDDPTHSARAEEMDVWIGDIGLLSGGFDLSFDWGGGGQVSTVDDLLRLVRGVTSGRCFRSESTRDLMLEPTVPIGLSLPRVGMGLGVHHHLVGSRHVVGHGGAWGVRVFHDPATDIAVAATIGRPDECAWLPALFDLAESTWDDHRRGLA